MHKLGRRQYLQMFCESLVATYGNTLVEGDTDLKMATALMRKLRRYLFFHPLEMSDKEWIKWRKAFLLRNMNRVEAEWDELGLTIKVPGKLKEAKGG